LYGIPGYQESNGTERHSTPLNGSTLYLGYNYKNKIIIENIYSPQKPIFKGFLSEMGKINNFKCKIIYLLSWVKSIKMNEKTCLLMPNLFILIVNEGYSY